MRYHPGFQAAFLAPCLLLAACGGGGGSGSVVPASKPVPTSGIAVNLQSANMTVTYQAAAVTAVGAKTGMGNITISAAGQGATITLTTDASGNLSGVAIPAGGITDTVITSGRSLTDPSTLQQPVSDSLGFTNEIAYSLSQVAAGQELTSSAYGVWASTVSPHADAGALAFGNLTAPASVPATGSATYNGFTIGMGGAINSGASSTLKGNAQIIANFATQAVTTNLTNFGTIPDLAGTSTIAGNAYTGALSGGALAGTINGNFYGAAAQETAGVWQASGGGNAWIGSFGAKQ